DAVGHGSDDPITVTLDGADTALTPFSGLSSDNAWLLLVADEIMGVTGATAVSGAQYQLAIVRERFDTKRLDHDSGVECFLIKRTTLAGCLFKADRDWSAGNSAEVK